MITEASDQTALFKQVDKIYHKTVETHLPAHTSSEELANIFQEFCSDKMSNNIPVLILLDLYLNLLIFLKLKKLPLLHLERTTPDEV